MQCLPKVLSVVAHMLILLLVKDRHNFIAWAVSRMPLRKTHKKLSTQNWIGWMIVDRQRLLRLVHREMLNHRPKFTWITINLMNLPKPPPTTSTVLLRGEEIRRNQTLRPVWLSLIIMLITPESVVIQHRNIHNSLKRINLLVRNLQKNQWNKWVKHTTNYHARLNKLEAV